MSGIGGLNGIGSACADCAGGARPPANASGELARLEVQLSDWVHCPSGKTPAGKAKIDEISGKIETIRTQIKKAEDAKSNAAPASQMVQGQEARGQEARGQDSAARELRFANRGAWLNLQA